MSILTLCKYCKTTIEFVKSIVGHSGRMIPLDILTHERHQCADRPVKIMRDKCRICHQEIFLDPTIRNPANNKLIPQDVWGNHKCAKIVRF
jgi:hypothetical protein